MGEDDEILSFARDRAPKARQRARTGMKGQTNQILPLEGLHLDVIMGDVESRQRLEEYKEKTRDEVWNSMKREATAKPSASSSSGPVEPADRSMFRRVRSFLYISNECWTTLHPNRKICPK